MKRGVLLGGGGEGPALPPRRPRTPSTLPPVLLCSALPPPCFHLFTVPFILPSISLCIHPFFPFFPPHFFGPFILSYTHLSLTLSTYPWNLASIQFVPWIFLSSLPPTPPFLHSSLHLWVHPFSNAIIPCFMMLLQCWPFPCSEDPGGSQHPRKSHL